MSKRAPSTDEIVKRASQGEDVSGYFTNKFALVKPVRRVSVGLTVGLLRELDRRAAGLKVSRQTVIEMLLWRALSEESSVRRYGA